MWSLTLGLHFTYSVGAVMTTKTEIIKELDRNAELMKKRYLKSGTNTDNLPDTVWWAMLRLFMARPESERV